MILIVMNASVMEAPWWNTEDWLCNEEIGFRPNLELLKANQFIGIIFATRTYVVSLCFSFKNLKMKD